MKLGLVAVLILSLTSAAWGAAAAPNAGILAALQEVDPCPPEALRELTFVPMPGVEGELNIEGIEGPVVAQSATYVNGDDEAFQIDVYGPNPEEVKNYTEEVRVCFDLTSSVLPGDEAIDDEPTEIPEGDVVVTPDLLIVIDFVGIWVADPEGKVAGEILFRLYEEGFGGMELQQAAQDRGLFCFGDQFWPKVAVDIAGGGFPETLDEMTEYIQLRSFGLGCSVLTQPEGEVSVTYLIDPTIPAPNPKTKFHNYVTKKDAKTATSEITISGGKVSFSIEKPDTTVIGPYGVTSYKKKSASSVDKGKFYLCVSNSFSESSKYSLKGTFGEYTAGAVVSAVKASSC